MLDRFYLAVFKLFTFLVRITPRTLMNGLLNTLATLAYLLDSRHKKIAKVNLDLAYGDNMAHDEKRRIIKQCYKNLLYNMRDFAENQGISKEALLQKVTLHNEHHYQNVLQEGKGIIFLTAHYGNWELLPLRLGLSFQSLWGVGRKLDHPKLNDILEKNRSQFNVHMLTKKGAIRGMLKALKNGEHVGLLVDQNTASREGILIDFFGKKARHTPSAALLARKTGAPIVPAFITTDDHQHYHVTFYEPIITKRTNDIDEDIRYSVQAQADITQKAIEKKPDEWFWLHRRWKNQYAELYQ